MYGYQWTKENGIYQLDINVSLEKEIRPVFKEELDYFGFDKYWNYPNTKAPLLWAEGIRRYILNGDCVAEIKGGGFYTEPKIKLHRESLELSPVSIESLWDKNKLLLTSLTQTAISFIQKQFSIYKKKGLSFVVAFSGGKDSILLLDLVSKALSPNDFYVIFGNTGMELSTTYAAVEKAKKRWPNLHFYEAKSDFSATDSWDSFGPPGRRLRWCCSVHKSVPTILKLREITGDYNIKAVVFDGIRAAESAARASYGEISVGAKNINQVNISPIYRWNTAELYLYLLHNDLLINDAYRIGMARVGCTICPLASNWWENIAINNFKDDIDPLLSKVISFSKNSSGKKDTQKYINDGGWKGRMGGRDLSNGGNRVNATIENDRITFYFSQKTQNWLAVAPLLGSCVDENVQRINGADINYSIESNHVSYWPITSLDRKHKSLLKGVAYKTAYCIGCRACEVQCPTGAFKIIDKQITIVEKNCIHCGNCITFVGGKGCLVAKSLSVTGGSMNLKGMNRYQHFGMKTAWLEHYFKNGSQCFSMGQLGNRQYDALKVWLREAELLNPDNKGDQSGMPTALAKKLAGLESYHLITWAIIWNNLAYHSVIVKWYMKFGPTDESFESSDLVNLLDDNYSISTRDNAVRALLDLFRSTRIGRDLGQGWDTKDGNSYTYIREGWQSPDPLAILYSVYKWAEVSNRRAFTLSQLVEEHDNAEVPGMDPISVFALDFDMFKDCLQQLAIHYPNFLSVSFVKDLDNVILKENTTSLDIVDLIMAEEGVEDVEI